MELEKVGCEIFLSGLFVSFYMRRGEEGASMAMV